MNTQVYPVPKNLLSMLVQNSYESGWEYVQEFTVNKLLQVIESSSNYAQCVFDKQKLKACRLSKLLFICLPCSLPIWRKFLKDYFFKENIDSLFKDFNRQIGVSGTYSQGYLIIVNSDYISNLKDAEEIIEHELIHVFETIDQAKHIISTTMSHILNLPEELKTWTVNVVNRLYSLYDHLIASAMGFNDSKEKRKKFLDDIFAEADCLPLNQFIQKYTLTDSSDLLHQSLWFFWSMCSWRPDEFLEFKSSIYREFEID